MLIGLLVGLQVDPFKSSYGILQGRLTVSSGLLNQQILIWKLILEMVSGSRVSRSQLLNPSWLKLTLFYLQIIIADEAHYLKNAQAKRTNACVPLLQVRSILSFSSKLLVLYKRFQCAFNVLALCED